MRPNNAPSPSPSPNTNVKEGLHPHQAFGIKVISNQNQSLDELAPAPNLYIFANAFTWVNAQKLPNYYDILKQSQVFADGVGTCIACYIETKKTPKRLSGPNFSQKALKIWREKPMLFVGGTKKGMDKIVNSFKLQHSYQYIPPYREVNQTNFQEDLEEITKLVDPKSIEILWVCLGCPKQEIWGHLAKNSSQLLNAKIFPIGAAFDFLSQEKQRAPEIMQKVGLEWVHRLFLEPKRLVKRYLIGNSLLLYYCLKNKLKK